MLCHRGCGLEAAHTTKKGLHACNKSAQSCPIVKKKIGDKSGATRRANPVKQSEETKALRSVLLKKQWDTGVRSKEAASKNFKMSDRTGFDQTGKIPWNKGLTAKDHPSIKKYADKQRGKRKLEAPEILSREDPIYRDFKKYRNRVAVRTQRTYEQFETEINPNGHPRGKAGIDGAYHLDHIKTVRQGFDEGASIEKMSSKENLQMLPWLENIQKYDGNRL